MLHLPFFQIPNVAGCDVHDEIGGGHTCGMPPPAPSPPRVPSASRPPSPSSPPSPARAPSPLGQPSPPSSPSSGRALSPAKSPRQVAGDDTARMTEEFASLYVDA